MTPHSYCLDQVSRWDRARGLALRYAPHSQREAGVVLLAFNLELAKVMPLVSEAALADIRFMWWQEALEELAAGQAGRNHPVVQGLASVGISHLWTQMNALLDGWRSVSRQQALDSWPDLNASLEATHGRLAQALLALDGEPASDPALVSAYARAWGYGSLRQALLKTGDLSLVPKSERPNASEDEAAQVADAAEALAEQGRQAYRDLQRLWPNLMPSGQGLLASAHLIPARLRDVERAHALAAWTLFKGHWRSKVFGL